MLNSLRISQFRAFKDLKIDRLGRVNLVVGKNNVGKTTLLEAVHLYASESALNTLNRVLRRRQEYFIENRSEVISYSNLFYRKSEQSAPIEIGEIQGQDQLVIRRMWRFTDIAEDGEGERIRYSEHLPDDLELEEIDATEVLRAKRGQNNFESMSIHSGRYSHRLRSKYEGSTSSLFLPFAGFQDDSIDPANLWDRIALTDKEFDILIALKVIDPDLERIVFIGDAPQRQVKVKLTGQDPISLRSLGDGMNRLFELTLGLVSVPEGKTFLVDEIDAGLHFTTLVDVWRLIFRVAENLNIQVFATTHSWNCIEAFQQAAVEHSAEGFLIRLEKGEEGIRAEVFSEEDLTIITRQSIEVR
ncbi:MAG: AAA family ATPase [Leptolyngbyaceae bacterium]|nr:AAA family ATPase [Leptolyngbyaceae bacterium]